MSTLSRSGWLGDDRLAIGSVGRHAIAQDSLVLDIAQQNKDQDDNQDHAQKAAWRITPTPRVRPCGHRAEQQQDQHDEQNGAEHLVLTLSGLRANGGKRGPSSLHVNVTRVTVASDLDVSAGNVTIE